METASIVGNRLKTVLIIDDEPSVLQLLSMVLKLDKKVPVSANNGQEALELLQSGTRFDAMITDITMPRMNGFELSKEARLLIPGLPILLISGFSQHSIEDAFDLINQGHTAFLHKPFTPADIMKAMAKLLG